MEKYRIKNLRIIVVLVITLLSCNGQSKRTTQKGQMPAFPSVYQSELTDGIVYFSKNGGLTWEDKSNGLPDKVTLGIGGLAVSGNSLGIATKDDGIYLFNLQNQIWVQTPTDEEIIKNNLGTLSFFKNHFFAVDICKIFLL